MWFITQSWNLLLLDYKDGSWWWHRKKLDRTPSQGEKEKRRKKFDCFGFQKTAIREQKHSQEQDFENWNFPIALLAHGNLSELWVASKEYIYISKRLLGSAGPTTGSCWHPADSKSSQSQLALTSFSFAPHRATTFGFLLQSAHFKLHKASDNQRPLQSPGCATGLGQDWEQVEQNLNRQQEQLTKTQQKAALPDTSGMAPATDEFLSYGAKRWAGLVFFF